MTVPERTWSDVDMVDVRYAELVLGARMNGLVRDGSPARAQFPPLIAFDQGVPLGVVLHQGIRTALYRSLFIGFCLPVRTALTRTRPMPVCWYGQQEASWVAYYDALRGFVVVRTEHVPGTPHEQSRVGEGRRGVPRWLASVSDMIGSRPGLTVPAGSIIAAANVDRPRTPDGSCAERVAR